MPMETESPAKPDGAPGASVFEALGDGSVAARCFRISLVASRAGRHRATRRPAGRSARALAARAVSSAADLSVGVPRDRRARRDGPSPGRRRAARAAPKRGGDRSETLNPQHARRRLGSANPADRRRGAGRRHAGRRRGRRRRSETATRAAVAECSGMRSTRELDERDADRRTALVRAR